MRTMFLAALFADICGNCLVAIRHCGFRDVGGLP